jgi:succinate dehydrogenase / fumarate reductase, cytochrome b subunit
MTQTLRPGGVEPIHKKARALPFPLNVYQTAIGKKWAMALSGGALLGFVVVHMIGNLHMYEGPNQVNQYAESLRELGGHLAPRTFVLWLLRLGLIGAFALHIHAAVTLTRMNITSNSKYQSPRDYAAVNFASRSMRWTGTIIGLYVIFHLMDLTWGVWLGDTYVRGDVYHNLTESLSTIPVTIIYIVANVALSIHIFHGVYSMFQSLGINSPTINKMRRNIAGGLATLILIGNLSFPIAAATGFFNEDNCKPREAAEQGHITVCSGNEGTSTDKEAGH